MKIFRENKRGFRTEDIPKNRLQLFKLIVKDYPATIVGINFALIAINSLSLFWGITGLYYIYTQYLDSGMEFTKILPLFGTYTAILIPCIFVTGPLVGGISLVLRNLARDDARNIKAYFKTGIKTSWKESLILSFTNAVIPALIWSAFYFYLPLIEKNKYFIFPLSLTVLICLAVLAVLPTLYVMVVSYELGLMQHIKNAIMLSVLNFPRVILVNLSTLLPLFLLALSMFFGGKIFVATSFVVFVYYFFAGFSLSALIKVFLANKLCEENLNQQLGINTHIGMTP